MSFLAIGQVFSQVLPTTHHLEATTPPPPPSCQGHPGRGSQTSFTLLKTEGPKELLFMGVLSIDVCHIRN